MNVSSYIKIFIYVIDCLLVLKYRQNDWIVTLGIFQIFIFRISQPSKYDHFVILCNMYYRILVSTVSTFMYTFYKLLLFFNRGKLRWIIKVFECTIILYTAVCIYYLNIGQTFGRLTIFLFLYLALNISNYILLQNHTGLVMSISGTKFDKIYWNAMIPNFTKFESVSTQNILF